MAKRSILHLGLLGLAIAGLLAPTLTWAAGARPQAGSRILPPPQPAFSGKINPSPEDSVPQWPKRLTPPKGAPNIVLILLDDAGFAATSTFGGLAQTPTLTKLAKEGLRYNRFHTTAVCSPTRAALLSGRNPHQVGYGGTAELNSGFPGYNGLWPKSAATIAEVLKQNGYSTAAFGKWHNTPGFEISQIGPFDHWPTQMGFEHFYGFMMGETSQWEPLLWRDTTAVEPPATPEAGYHFTTDIASEAISWLHTQEALAPDKPYLLYFAPAGAHKPHHVPADWIARYRGQFDKGWDQIRSDTFERQKALGVIPKDTVLTPRPDGIAAWESLTPDQKRLAAHEMETFAAFLSHTDNEIGRVIKTIRDGPQGDNTLILYIASDNGASGMDGLLGNDETNAPVAPVETQLRRLSEAGGPDHLNAYSAGWAWMNNTPFQWMKLNGSHLGGVRVPLVVSWPHHISDAGGVRTQFTDVNDVAATLYEAVGIRSPAFVNGVAQIPLEGKSFLGSLTDAKAPAHHQVQYFENWGDNAIYSDGWMASLRRRTPWLSLLNGATNRTTAQWELYNLETDYSQAHNLAAAEPKKLAEMEALFDQEARRNQVYPTGLSVDQANASPSLGRERATFSFYRDMPVLSWQAAPNMARSHQIRAAITVPERNGDGVIFTRGSRIGGFSLYVKDGHLTYENNYQGRLREKIVSPETLSAGKTDIRFEFTSDPAPKLAEKRFGRSEYAGTGRLYINDRLVSEGRLEHVANPYIGMTSLTVGRAANSPVSKDYSLPFTYGGQIDKVEVELR